MGAEESWSWQPIASPTLNGGSSQVHFSQFDTSVNAVSFGFVATAILISMFLFMAIFERFLQPHFPHFPISANHDIESQPPFNPKLAHSSPKMTVYSQEVSVLMPGEETPTFIAQPVPLPCPPDRIQWPPPKHMLVPNASQSSNTSTFVSTSRNR